MATIQEKLSVLANTMDNAETVSQEQLDKEKKNVSLVDYKMVTFSLAGKDYGIDIMKVKEIVKAGHFTYVPNTLPFVRGVYNLRGDIIPIIDLHRRFHIDFSNGVEELDELESGFIIINIDGNQIGIIIDRVSRVVSVDAAEVQEPPKMMGGIGSEYIKGVVRTTDENFLIMLDIIKLFDPKEMQKILIDNRK